MEDTMDSHIKALYPQKDIVSLRTLNDSSRENKIGFRELIKSGLRNNPDWMIVAETRGDEAYDMLQSALTDHSIITTVHARGAEAIPSRILSMIGQGYQINERLVGRDITDVLKIGIYMTIEETENGMERYIREIVEFVDFTDNGVLVNPLYRVKKDFDPDKGVYKKRVEVRPLTKELVDNLTYKRVFHLIPEIFLPKSKEERRVAQ